MSTSTSAQNNKKTEESTVTLSHEPTLRDLQERYKMDAAIWEASKRGFPFNIPHRAVVTIALGLPTLAAFTLIDFSKITLWTIIGLIVLVSIISFQITDKAILQFKGVLAEKGLFGKDLNKAGAKEDKPKV